jgi:hypothetical protein
MRFAPDEANLIVGFKGFESIFYPTLYLSVVGETYGKLAMPLCF